mgnify:CR=1 FL=1
MNEYRLVDLTEIESARVNLPTSVFQTPLLHSTALSSQIGKKAWLKCENLQATGSYKIRAAFTVLNSLTDKQKEKGAALSSSGNFAAAFAYAGMQLGVPTTIVMMRKTSPYKAEKVRGYGAEIVWCENRFDARFETLDRLSAERSLTIINHMEDPTVIAGHGTVGLEIAEELPDLDVVLVPVSTGGLIAGVATAVKHLKPNTKIIGVQPEGSNATHLSLQRKEVATIPEANTICDALTATHPGRLPFEHIQQYVDEMVLVTDDEAKAAVAWLAGHAKLIVEAGGAVGVAALLTGKTEVADNVCALLSGGNIASATLTDYLETAIG